jgi:hypothetical protein
MARMTWRISYISSRYFVLYSESMPDLSLSVHQIMHIMSRYHHARPLSYHLPFIARQLSSQECYLRYQSCPHTGVPAYQHTSTRPHPMSLYKSPYITTHSPSPCRLTFERDTLVLCIFCPLFNSSSRSRAFGKFCAASHHR